MPEDWNPILEKTLKTLTAEYNGYMHAVRGLSLPPSASDHFAEGWNLAHQDLAGRNFVCGPRPGKPPKDYRTYLGRRGFTDGTFEWVTVVWLDERANASFRPHYSSLAGAYADDDAWTHWMPVPYRDYPDAASRLGLPGWFDGPPDEAFFDHVIVQFPTTVGATAVQWEWIHRHTDGRWFRAGDQPELDAPFDVSVVELHYPIPTPRPNAIDEARANRQNAPTAENQEGAGDDVRV